MARWPWPRSLKNTNSFLRVEAKPGTDERRPVASETSGRRRHSGAGTSPLSRQMIRFLQEGARNLFAATAIQTYCHSAASVFGRPGASPQNPAPGAAKPKSSPTKPRLQSSLVACGSRTGCSRAGNSFDSTSGAIDSIPGFAAAAGDRPFACSDGTAAKEDRSSAGKRSAGKHRWYPG